MYSCSSGSTQSLSKARDSIKILSKSNEELNAKITTLKAEIEALKFPPAQRLQKINLLIDSDQLNEAKTQIKYLTNLFPESEEAKSTGSLIARISEKEALIEAEKQRIKALGFKALKPVGKVNIENNVVSISNIGTGKEFVHDTYSTYSGSSWFYNTSDKGNKFVYCAMSVTSTEKNPDIPTLAIYSISGDKLIKEGTFRIEFARWDNYGSYLGNEPDTRNDFSKVNTVSFKLGCEVNESILNKPYVIVLKKSNTQSRHYERFENPPITYSGEANYPASLSIEDFSNNYVAIRVANLK